MGRHFLKSVVSQFRSPYHVTGSEGQNVYVVWKVSDGNAIHISKSNDAGKTLEIKEIGLVHGTYPKYANADEYI